MLNKSSKKINTVDTVTISSCYQKIHRSFLDNLVKKHNSIKYDSTLHNGNELEPKLVEGQLQEMKQLCQLQLFYDKQTAKYTELKKCPVIMEPKVHHHHHKSPSDPVMRQFTAFHILTTHFTVTLLPPGLVSNLFP
jgi:hypothetical protein